MCYSYKTPQTLGCSVSHDFVFNSLCCTIAILTFITIHLTLSMRWSEFIIQILFIVYNNKKKKLKFTKELLLKPNLLPPIFFFFRIVYFVNIWSNVQPHLSPRPSPFSRPSLMAIRNPILIPCYYSLTTINFLPSPNSVF